MSRRNQREETRRLLREHGLRATPARIAVLLFLEKADQPSTHQEICDRLQQTSGDKSTIFRALNDLAEAGLVRRMELGDHVWRYERMPAVADGEAAQAPHPHLLCMDCGAIRCLDDADVSVRVATTVGTVEDVLLKGHCASCVAGSR